MNNDPSSPYVDINLASVGLEYEDWTYSKRRVMQEIVPGLYLGPYAAANKNALSKLEGAGITHVVCVRQEIEKHLIKPNFEGQLQYLVITLADSCLETIIPKVKEVKDFIDACLGAGGKVLVHCNDGMSRSGSLVIAYIMQTYGTDFKAALNHVQQRRFCVQPNDGFEQQLREYEPIYRAMIEGGAGMRRGAGAEFGKREREDSSDEEGHEDIGVKCRVRDREENMDQ